MRNRIVEITATVPMAEIAGDVLGAVCLIAFIGQIFFLAGVLQ